MKSPIVEWRINVSSQVIHDFIYYTFYFSSKKGFLSFWKSVSIHEVERNPRSENFEFMGKQVNTQEVLNKLRNGKFPTIWTFYREGWL